MSRGTDKFEFAFKTDIPFGKWSSNEGLISLTDAL